ncbi:hypothetical protein C8R43DRAFT_296963 [Mycena crocata]|nr:hypothetical protein C8R43DRAFT_296963 [Mycena crocata]
MLAICIFSLALSLYVEAFPLAPAKQVTIQVGGNSSSPGGPVQFHPNLALATNGTIVTFQFTGAPGNHSVTQSSFTSPCQPLAGGFDSGWVSVPQSLPAPPEWNLTITNDQIPIWFYCKQLSKVPHCNAGMVGALNVEVTNKSLPEFESFASIATSVLPGQSQGGFVGIGASATGAPFIPNGAVLVNSALQTVTPTGTEGGGSGSPGTTGDSGSPVNTPTNSSSSPSPSPNINSAPRRNAGASIWAIGLFLGIRGLF